MEWSKKLVAHPAYFSSHKYNIPQNAFLYAHDSQQFDKEILRNSISLSSITLKMQQGHAKNTRNTNFIRVGLKTFITLHRNLKNME